MKPAELHSALLKIAKDDPLTLVNNLLGYFDDKEVEEAVFATEYIKNEHTSQQS